MPNITFSSPGYKDKTVYAAAGSHTETILKIAKANTIPIGFSCEDGECGSCLIKVVPLEDRKRMGGPLTEKEKSVLVASGRLGKEEVEKMALDDLPSPWRLACQMVTIQLPRLLSAFRRQKCSHTGSMLRAFSLAANKMQAI